MNYENVEILDEKEITNLYDEIMNNSDNILLSATGTVWYVNCTNGRTGYHVEPEFYGSIGRVNYAGEYHSSGSRYNICGAGQYGYSLAIANFDTEQHGTIWYTKCSNGTDGYFTEPNYYAARGSSFYLVQYGGDLYSVSGVCGNGVYGYTIAVANF